MHPKFKKNFVRKNLPNGKPNPKYVDLLDEDKKINNQEFVCLSFISPEDIIKKKELYYFEEFVKQWNFNKSLEKFTQFLNFLSVKYDLPFESLTTDMKEFIDEEKKNIYMSVSDDYKTFIEKNEDAMEKAYLEKNAFQTCTRGIKVRGSYPTQEDAELRCKLLREKDPNHDIFVGPVGIWIPFNPDAYKTGRVEFMEEELNQLMANKANNEKRAKEEFDDRIKETKEKAMEENRKMAEKTGNRLTQTNENIGDIDTIEKDLSALTINPDKIKMSTIERDIVNSGLNLSNIDQVLFDDTNVVVGKTDHGQSRLISGPFAPKNIASMSESNEKEKET